MDDEYLKIDGMDDAIIGHCSTWRDSALYTILVYDADKIVQILVERDGMEESDAKDYVAENIECAYLGVTTPIIVWTVGGYDDYG